MGKKKGATRAELLSQAVEYQEVKSAAADLTEVPDAQLEAVIAGSRVAVEAASASHRDHRQHEIHPPDLN